MKKTFRLFVCFGALFLVGCETRSISNSGYNGGYGRWNANSTYRGELSEFDILGTASAAETTQSNISRVLDAAVAPKIKRGDKLVLIQSGAAVPDNDMMDAAGRYFSVAPFSGIPTGEKSTLAGSLRLRAAQGGYHYILCVWGVLESANHDKETRAVSWIPIVGPFVPDQKEQMRIRLRAILLDVATGNWKMFTPETYSDANFSSTFSREARDQKLVAALKEKGCQGLIASLVAE